jgi:nucleoside-diphosphate-sugar epimerase
MAERVLVTGACGSIGPFVVRELKRKGYEVVATDLPEADKRKLKELDCEVRNADLLSIDQAASVMRDIDVVVHTAARMNFFMTRPEFELANHQVTVNTCEAAANSGVRRFIHYSTADVYGTPKYTPIDEGHPYGPVGLYGVTKTLGEQAVWRCHRDRGLPISIVRPSAVYGPDNATVMGILLEMPVLIRGMGIDKLWVPRAGFKANIVHVEDVAAASVFLIDKDEAIGEAYNVADDTVLCLGDLIEVLLNSVGVRCEKVLPVPTTLMAIAARAGSHVPRAFFTLINGFLQKRWDSDVFEYNLRPMLRPRFEPGITEFGRGDYVFDISKLKSLGYQLRHPDLKKGWNESVRWYVEQEWIPPYEPIDTC